jgi:hypothetical protein
VRSSQSGTGLRDFPLRLLHEVAPQIDSIDRQRVVAGHAELAWPEPAAWTALHRVAA